MILHLTKKNGKWLVNDKTYHELNSIEQKFLEDFIIKSKLEYPIKHEREQKPLPNLGELLNQK